MKAKMSTITIEIEIPDNLVSQVAPMIERQQYVLAPQGGKYGYVVPSTSISLAEIHRGEKLREARAS